MKVKIEKDENGEAFFKIPEKCQEELGWNEGDLIEWIDNKDGSWTLKRVSKLEVLKEKAFTNPEVKEEYDRISTSYNIDQQSFDAFKEVLDAPPKVNKGMKDLLSRELPWDNPEEDK